MQVTCTFLLVGLSELILELTLTPAPPLVLTVTRSQDLLLYKNETTQCISYCPEVFRKNTINTSLQTTAELLSD